MLIRETARALLKLVQADAKAKVKTVGVSSWTRVADSGDSVTLIIKIDCIGKNHTTLDEFEKE